MMLRQRENPDAFKAGMFSVLVHAFLLGALLISFNWKNTHQVSIAQVELWDSVPAVEQKPLPPQPLPEKVPEPLPVQKEIPEPEPILKPEVKPEPQVEIAIEKKPVEKKIDKPVKKEPPKPDAKAEDTRKKLLEQMRQEDLTKEPKVMAKPNSDALKDLQQKVLNEEKAAGDSKANAAKMAASAGVVDEFKAKIQAKIRSNVNKTLCGSGNPELKFEIGLMPTGELSGVPKLVKSSGSAACDDAVDRAIRMSEPLPLPPDTSLFSQFRNLKLTFKPNEG